MLVDEDATAKRLDVVFLKPVYCPNRCGETLFARSLDHHLEALCPLRKTECPHGCGEALLGRDVEAHDAACPFPILFAKGDVAVREGAIKELREVIAEVYEERARAEARVRSRGEQPRVEGGWVRDICKQRARWLENEHMKLAQRLRFRARERLQAAMSDDEVEDEGQKKAALGAATRPWDLEAPHLEHLKDALVEASVSGENKDLRQRCERKLMLECRRMLESALAHIEQDRSEVLNVAAERAGEALRAVELEPVDGMADLLAQVHDAIHLSKLQALPACDPDFHQAVQNGDVDLCAWLFDRERANPSAVDPRNGLPAIVVAAKAGDLPLCHLLLRKHADVDARCASDGSCALHWAAHLRYAKVLELLLAFNANPRLQDKRGLDALMKLVRRDVRAAAPGCTWLWEEKHGELHTGPKLHELSGEMLLDEAKALAESKAGCAGLSVHGHDATLVMHGMPGYITFHGPEPVVHHHRPGSTQSLKPEGRLASSQSTRSPSRASAARGPSKAGESRSPSKRHGSSPSKAGTEAASRAPSRAGAMPSKAASRAPSRSGAASKAEARPSSHASSGGEHGKAAASRPSSKERSKEAASPGKPRSTGKDSTVHTNHFPPPPAASDKGPGAGSRRGNSASSSLGASDSPRSPSKEEGALLPPFLTFVKKQSSIVHDVELMLKAGADSTTQDLSGLTALHHHLLSSPGRGSPAVVEALLKANADVNHRDNGPRSTTPLLIAVTSKRADLLQLMISEAFPPADVDTRSSDGQSALAIAEAAGALEVAKVLRSVGATIWSDVECVLGRETALLFDTRPPRPVPFG
mmetsp:Transcript_58890/g.140516  ORF Transcript_58890/g.140516 Transcript_58890/m.140516 type:complete len:814 (-) Transcript_58890:149-2590(-)|eukprot:CAMPEP_0178382666 /NCGR_PEP_ID=MMETSP0689_2-20121128/6608_1 /TAXON_ID=160604 /ORGANISM="Amphidinium massartii, Strain CS-259" /LENGTH=813 /DNA_ID=CAMNT_0020002871 /DNA_START=75 /DNA_END=2516 /DNA_ORIENTATION=+